MQLVSDLLNNWEQLAVRVWKNLLVFTSWRTRVYVNEYELDLAVLMCNYKSLSSSLWHNTSVKQQATVKSKLARKDDYVYEYVL